MQGTKPVYRNLCHFYVLIVNYQKEKLGKQSHMQLHQKNKIPRNEFNQGGEHWKLVYTENYRSILGDISDTLGSVPDHHNKANTAVAWVTQIFSFPVHMLCL